MFDYITLRIIWWVLLGVVLIGFAIMDGFDLGAQMLVPFAGRSDKERRMVVNTIGPVWEGNQVWFILGGGAIFAAWPPLYSVAFSGFYMAMMLALSAFIMRPVAFKFRSKVKYGGWRTFWDWVLSISGFIVPLVAGVAVGNVLQGVPFHFDQDMRPFYTGSFFALFNPFALLTGVLSVTMMLMQGGLYLATKTVDDIRERSIRIAKIAALITMLLFIAGGFYQLYFASGFTITSNVNVNGPSMPVGKAVSIVQKAWLQNYVNYPWMLLAPILGLIGSLGAFGMCRFGQSRLAFVLSSISILGIISTVGLSMYPFILPSSSNPGHSLTVYDASSSKLALGLMLFFAVVFLPIVLSYTSWVYYVVRGKITEQFFDTHQQDMY